MIGALLSARATDWPDRWVIPALEQAGILGPEERERLEQAGGKSAWLACIAAGIASDDDILEAVAKRFRMPVAHAGDISAGNASLLPGELAMRLRVVPLDVVGSVLHVACADPTDFDLDNAVAFAASHRVSLHLASPATIENGLANLYPSTAVSLLHDPLESDWQIPA